MCADTDVGDDRRCADVYVTCGACAPRFTHSPPVATSSSWRFTFAHVHACALSCVYTSIINNHRVSRAFYACIHTEVINANVHQSKTAAARPRNSLWSTDRRRSQIASGHRNFGGIFAMFRDAVWRMLLRPLTLFIAFRRRRRRRRRPFIIHARTRRCVCDASWRSRNRFRFDACRVCRALIHLRRRGRTIDDTRR